MRQRLTERISQAVLPSGASPSLDPVAGPGGQILMNRLTQGSPPYPSIYWANSWYANQVNKRALIEVDGLSLHDAHALELFKNEGLAPDADQRVARFFRR